MAMYKDASQAPFPTVPTTEQVQGVEYKER